MPTDDKDDSEEEPLERSEQDEDMGTDEPEEISALPVAALAQEPGASARSLFVDLMSTQLSYERSRKDSIERRGITVITSSGAFATLVFAIAALVTKLEHTQNFTAMERDWLVTGVVAFFFAALLGLAVNVPLPYGNFKPMKVYRDYRRYRKPFQKKNGKSSDPAETFADGIVDTAAHAWILAARWNQVKAMTLAVAFGMEVTGIAAVAVAVGLVLSSAITKG